MEIIRRTCFTIMVVLSTLIAEDNLVKATTDLRNYTWVKVSSIGSPLNDKQQSALCDFEYVDLTALCKNEKDAKTGACTVLCLNLFGEKGFNNCFSFILNGALNPAAAKKEDIDYICGCSFNPNAGEENGSEFHFFTGKPLKDSPDLVKEKTCPKNKLSPFRVNGGTHWMHMCDHTGDCP